MECLVNGLEIKRKFIDEYKADHILDYLKSAAFSYQETIAENFKVKRAHYQNNEDSEESRFLVRHLHNLGFGDFLDFDHITIVWYNDGSSEVPFHVDGSSFKEPKSKVGTLSLGSPKVFELRKIGTNDIQSFKLFHGDFLTMTDEVQSIYEHRVPKSDIDGERFTVYMFKKRVET